MRIFLALPLPAEARAVLARLAAELAPGQMPGRAVADENLHLTLIFLGQMGGAELEALDAQMQGLAAEPVRLEFQGWQALGGAAPKVLALGATGPEALHGRVLSRLRAAGLTPGRRRFRPHVTLVRLPRRPAPGRGARLAAILGNRAPRIAPVRVDRLGLYRSHLSPRGARYEMLAHYPLGRGRALPEATPRDRL